MANRIYLQAIGNDTIFDAPLTEDFTISNESTITSWGELVGSLSQYKDIIVTYFAGKGTISKSLEALIGAFDLPRWTSTPPPRINAKLLFYTKTKAEIDVFYPMTFISSLSILTDAGNGTFIVPGMSAQNIIKVLGGGYNTSKTSDLSNQMGAFLSNKANKFLKASDFSTGGKIISLEIPGVIYLKYALVISAQGTYSKQRTSTGFPLWGSIDLVAQGLLPASDDIYKQVNVFLGGSLSAPTGQTYDNLG